MSPLAPPPAGGTRLSVVIPCGPRVQHLPGQLAALAAQSVPFAWEVILVANSRSAFPALRRAAEGFAGRLPHLRLEDATRVPGPAHARNAGARIARAELLAFADADDEVGAGWAAAMAEAVGRHGFVASRLETRRLNPRWALENPQVQGLQTLWYPPYLPHASASGLGVRRGAHEAVGGFDEGWPGLEDTEYCIRMQRAGTALHFAPEAVVHYRMRSAPREVFAQARLWARYNLLLYRRYGSGSPPVPDPWGRYRRAWRRLCGQWLGIRRREDLLQASFALGWQVGTLAGCLRYRVPPVTAW